MENVRRFDDFLRILTSVLLGLVLKDFDKLIRNLRDYFDGTSGSSTALATTIAALLVITFVRNAHGSASYDRWVENHSLSLWWERWTLGRFISFLLPIVGLAAGPFLVGLLLCKDPPAQQKLNPGVFPLWELFIVLFLPFLVYFVWDILLWLSRPEDGTVRLPTVQQLSSRWMKIDAIAFIIFAFGLVRYIVFHEEGRATPPRDVAVLFMIVAGITTVADYVWNADFYFPERRN